MIESDTEKAAVHGFSDLQLHSSQLGADPWQVQGAGGNTSIKHDDVLWIKASGKWLMHATDEDMFVPVQRSALLDAFSRQDPRAEKSLDFVIDELNPQGLRPSIETTLHAVLEQKVVFHVHCVDTIAIAIRQDAEQYLDSRLNAFNWAFVPYVRPGLPLSRSIAARIQPQTDVLVLGNHGLVVAADTVDACLALLQDVRLALHCVPRSILNPQSQVDGSDIRLAKLNKLCATTAYQPAQYIESHAIAFDETALRIAEGGSLYPDHVIFLGKGTDIALIEEDCDAVLGRYKANKCSEPASIVFPGVGVVLLDTATPGQQAMARCLADVCLRVPPTAVINYLSDEQNHELLNWEAEQYRQVLNQNPA